MTPTSAKRESEDISANKITRVKGKTDGPDSETVGGGQSSQGGEMKEPNVKEDK